MSTLPAICNRSFSRSNRHESPETLVEVKGEIKGKTMEVVSHGPVDILNKRMVIDYEPRSVIQDVLGPLDRLPGLHVGQRWESQVINPFTGQVSPVKVEVKRRGLIHWNGNPVTDLRGRAAHGPAVDADVGASRTG